MYVTWNLADDRYVAIEKIRRLLGFKKAELKALLNALSKTDNGWLQYMFGNVTLDLKKFVDVDEIHILVENKTNERLTKSLKYVFDLKDFTKPRVKNLRFSR